MPNSSGTLQVLLTGFPSIYLRIHDYLASEIEVKQMYNFLKKHYFYLNILLEQVKDFAILLYHEAQFGSSGCFCWALELDAPPWIEMQSSPDILQICLYCLKNSLRIYDFWAYLILPDCQGSCNLSDTSSIIWFWYCDQLCLYFSPNMILVTSVALWPSFNS